MLNEIDKILQATVPTVVVPRHGTFEPLAHNGHRLLVASTGLWLEVRRDWLYARQAIALLDAPVAIPYGDIHPVCEVLCGKPPAALLQRFEQQAVEASPLETAAWITWNSETKTWRYRNLELRSQSHSHVEIVRPTLDANEHLVVDLHSHGVLAPYFSATDDIDDQGEVKLAVVVGDCQAREPATVGRLCCLGVNRPLNQLTFTEGTWTI